MSSPHQPSFERSDILKPMLDHLEINDVAFFNSLPQKVLANLIGKGHPPVSSATVEGFVAKVFTSKSGNTFLNIGATYPNQTFTGWIPPASPVNGSPILSEIEGKRVKITGRIEIYEGKPEIRINAASQLEFDK